MDLERILCRTIGCTSFFARFWEWPHRVVCTPMSTRGLKKAYGINLNDMTEVDFIDYVPDKGMSGDRADERRTPERAGDEDRQTTATAQPPGEDPGSQ